MPDATSNKDFMRITIRLCRHTDPALFNAISGVQPYFRSRRLVTLAAVGLITEQNQGKIANAPIQALAASDGLGMPESSIPAVQSNGQAASVLMATTDRLPLEEDVHYPGAGSTNISFESVFGPIE